MSSNPFDDDAEDEEDTEINPFDDFGNDSDIAKDPFSDDKPQISSISSANINTNTDTNTLTHTNPFSTDSTRNPFSTDTTRNPFSDDTIQNPFSSDDNNNKHPFSDETPPQPVSKASVPQSQPPPSRRRDSVGSIANPFDEPDEPDEPNPFADDDEGGNPFDDDIFGEKPPPPPKPTLNIPIPKPYSESKPRTYSNAVEEGIFGEKISDLDMSNPFDDDSGVNSNSEKQSGRPSKSSDVAKPQSPNRRATVEVKPDDQPIIEETKEEYLDSESEKEGELMELSDGYEPLSLVDDDYGGDNLNFGDLFEDLDHFQQDPIIQTALNQEKDIRIFKDDIGKQLSSSCDDLMYEYIDQLDKWTDLNTDIQDTNSFLCNIEYVLASFTNKLSEISTEIQRLQEQSLEKNAKLINRKTVNSKLKYFLNKVALPEAVVSNILDTNLIDGFQECLEQILYRLSYCRQMEGDPDVFDIVPGDTPSAAIMIGELEKLLSIALNKAKTYLLKQMSSLKDGNIKISALQNTFLSNIKIFQYLSRESPDYYNDIKKSYLNTSSSLYVNVFKTYIKAIKKIYHESATKNDVIVIAENNLKTISRQNTVFLLNDLPQLILEYNSPPVPLHGNEDDSEITFTLPQAVRNLLKYFYDIIKTEYNFTIEFFECSDNEMLNDIVEKTFNTIRKYLEDISGDCYHLPSILVSIIIIEKFYHETEDLTQYELLNDLFNNLLDLLWTQYDTVVNNNIASMNNNKSEALQLEPYYTIFRFSSLYKCLLFSLKYFTDNLSTEKIIPIICQLKVQLQVYLEEISSSFKTLRDKKIFLIKNLGEIVIDLQDLEIENQYLNLKSEYEELLQSAQEELLQVMLNEYFDKMIKFIKEQENKINQNPHINLSNHLTTEMNTGIKNIIQSFASKWKSNFEKINEDLNRYFPDDYQKYLKDILDRFTKIYTQWSDYIKLIFPKGNPYSKDTVTLQQIFVEFQKYKI